MLSRQVSSLTRGSRALDMRFPFLNKRPSPVKFLIFGGLRASENRSKRDENTVDFFSEQVIGKEKGLVACPESAGPQLQFVFGGEHQNESQVYFRISNVLKVSNCKTVTTFFQKLFKVCEVSSLVMFGNSSSSNRNALC